MMHACACWSHLGTMMLRNVAVSAPPLEFISHKDGTRLEIRG